LRLSGLSRFFGLSGLFSFSGFFGFFGLFGPSEIGSPWSSFHNPQGKSHFTPYTALQGKPCTLQLQGTPRTLRYVKGRWGRCLIVEYSWV
jgi:hypothetical protein